MDYQVLLYCNYTKIEEPKKFAKNRLAFCKFLDLKGCILVAEERVNGTMSGAAENITAYMEAMKADPRFADTMFKTDPSEGCVFKKMFVKYRPGLVSSELEKDTDPDQVTGAYLSPQEFKEAILDGQAVMTGTRDDYECDLGHFWGAVRPDVRGFQELPDWIREHKEKLIEEWVVTYYTGGIRCGRFSSWLVRERFKDIGQLYDGIAIYGKDPEVQGELWNGKMCVFDERVTVDINRVGEQIVGRGWFDGTSCERYINCSNPECNRQVFASTENEEEHLGVCSVECAKHPRNCYVQDHGISSEEAELRFTALNK